MEQGTMQIRIHDRKIGPGQPTLVVAELGVNHDGSLARAMELVEYAAGAGADAVKLQIFRAQTLLHSSCTMADYQKARCSDSDAAEMLRRYELYPDELRKIVDAVVSRGLIPLATPFSPADVQTIAQLDLPAIKIASPDLVNLPLLRAAAKLNRPLLISTGAAEIEEIASTAEWLRQQKADFALLHCVSAYPANSRDANLCWIADLADRFGVPVGYSDHTTEELTGAMAVIAGACIIEKHMTHDHKAAGPDHAASADPEQFTRYTRAIRLADRLKGSGSRHVLPVERNVRTVSRQSLVLIRPVSAGQAISEADLTVQRPGTGLPAAMVDQVIGRSAVRDLPVGTLLQWDMLAGPHPPEASPPPPPVMDPPAAKRKAR
jgi:N,N'-diacetyllegionaminate synthase